MQKRLKPTMREKKRYVLIKTDSKEKAEKAILEFIGVLGYSQSGIKFIKDEKIKEGEIVLATNRESLNEIKASMMFKEIEVKKVSGTLKGLFNK